MFNVENPFKYFIDLNADVNFKLNYKRCHCNFFFFFKQQETFAFEQKCIQNGNGLLRKMWIWEKFTGMVEETVGDKFGETNHENTHIDSCIWALQSEKCTKFNL